MSYRITLPYRASPPLHGNQRYTPPQERRIIAQVKKDAGWLAKAAGIGTGHHHITVWIEWRPTAIRRRDGSENLGPLQKALIDGLVAVNVVPDDTPEHVTRLEPVLLEPDRATAGLWLCVEVG